MSFAASQASGDLSFILKELLNTPHTLRAVLVSGDGLLTAASDDCDRDLGDKTAAAVAGLQSLSREAAPFADCEGPGDLTLIQYPRGGYVFLMAAGQGTHLAVSADDGADVEQVSYAMETTVSRLGSHLDIALRAVEESDA